MTVNAIRREPGGARRGVVAVLTDEYAPLQQQMVESIAEVLDAAGFATLCVNGRELDPPDRHHRRFTVCNQIFTLVQRSEVNGVLCLSGTLARQGDMVVLDRLVRGFAVPVISVGCQAPDTVSVAMCEREATHALMRHLLQDRNRRRFAFVRGFRNDAHSHEREAVFSTALRNAPHPVEEPQYILGDYDAFTTYRAVSDLLERHPRIDTIVAANDTMALSAARAVSATGRAIPSDVAITGFDDTPEATTHSPPLTTVRLPIVSMAEHAARSLVACMTNRQRPGQLRQLTEIDAELVIRGSTSSMCLDQAMPDTADSRMLAGRLQEALIGLQAPEAIDLDAIAQALLQTVHTDRDELTSYLSQLPKPRSDEEELHWWSTLCDRIESLALPILAQRGRLQRSTLIVAALAQRREHIWAARMSCEFVERRSGAIRGDMQLEISSCSTPEQIIATLGRWMENLKPRRAYVVGYDGPALQPPERATLLQHYIDGVARPCPSDSFATHRLLPDSLGPELLRGRLVLNPLYAGDALFGHLMIDPTDISLLRIDSAAHSIGNAMRNRHLFRALERQARALSESNAELAKLADDDTLTGLPNRRRFQRYLSDACADAGRAPFALCFLDLDGFKQINDTIGHKAGDLLLEEVARRLVETLGQVAPGRAFVARLGGDEFTVVLDGVSDAAALDPIAESILRSLARPYRLEGRGATLSASIGAALFPEQAGSATGLLRLADEAMYAAKRAGKNRYTLHRTTIRDDERHRLELTGALEQALHRDALHLHLRPRIDLASGALEAADGLMRWPAEPGGGDDRDDVTAIVAGPERFVALAEQAGLIETLERCALDQACRQARRWLDHSTPLPISIGISVLSWREGGVASAVERALLDHALPGRWLEIELNEVALTSDLQASLQQLQALRSLGVSLTIDGFGTHACSIACLARLAADRAKIDRALLQALDGPPGDGPSAALSAYRATIALADGLGMRTIALGVETAAQQRLVSELGCSAAQGPAYDAPGATALPGDASTPRAVA